MCEMIYAKLVVVNDNTAKLVNVVLNLSQNSKGKKVQYVSIALIEVFMEGIKGSGSH